MAWTSVVEQGNKVSTPHGIGIVERISTNNGTARVNVGGQLFEVPEEMVNQIPLNGEQKPQGVPFKENSELVKGVAVQRATDGAQGKIIAETQRSVTVKWVDSGKTGKWIKKDIIDNKPLLNPAGEQEKKTPEQEEVEKEQKRQEEREQRTPETQAQDTASDLYGLFNLKDKLESKIESEVDGELKELRNAIKQKQHLEVKVGDKVNVVKGLKHKQLEQLINYSALRLSPLLVGMAGTGKTHAAEQVAESLGLPFFSISVGAQTTKTDIMGYMDAGGNYVRTHFREAYENGGVFLMDEIDAGNANVLITINAALSNGLSAFPDAMIKKHEDFVFIASANTFGNGANRQYVGRNQLDAATLDRFAIIEWFIDDELEKNLTHGRFGDAWYAAVRAARDYVAEKNIRALVSPRATQKGSKLLDIGQPVDEVIEATLLGSVPQDKKADVKQVAKTIFDKLSSGVPKNLPKEVDPPTAADLVKPSPVITLRSEDIPF